MKARCYNSSNPRFEEYGGKGVKICEEWLKDFTKFYNWSLKNGYEDNLSIDRKDVNGNYSPNNCRWATAEEQMNNTTVNHFVTINGVKKTISQWSRVYNIKSTTIFTRIKRGMNEIEAITTPLKRRMNKSGI